MTEKRAAERFIYQALSTDAPLVALVGTKIARGMQLQGAVPPYVIYSFLSGTERLCLPATQRIFDNMTYLVKAVIKGDSAIPAYDIEDRIETALIGNNGTVTFGAVTWQVGPFVKEIDISYDELTPEGQHFIHAGAQYRAWVYRLS